MIRVPKITSDRIPMRQANAGGADRAAVPIDVELAVFEQFPPSIRHALNETTIKVNSLSIVEYYNWAVRNGHGSAKVVQKVHELEANDLAVFAGRHRARHGYVLPHVAADATILRYGLMGPSRHPARRFGGPIMRPPAKRKRVARGAR